MSQRDRRTGRSRGRLEWQLGIRGEPGKTKALSDEGASGRGGGRGRRHNAGGGRERGGTREGLFLLTVVDKVAAHPVWTEADGVEGAARLRFVLWVSVQVAQLFGPMRKLTLAAVFAEAAFGERSAQFGLVA